MLILTCKERGDFVSSTSSMYVYVSNLPEKAMNLLQDAILLAYGEDVGITINELESTILRQRVKLGGMSVGVQLIVLGEESAEICKHIIESPDYPKEKLHIYKSMGDLVEFLNNKYDLKLVAEDSEALESIEEYEYEDDSSEVIEEYRRMLSESNKALEEIKQVLMDKDYIIKNLESRLKELEFSDSDLGFEGEGEEVTLEEGSDLDNMVSKDDYDALIKELEDSRVLLKEYQDKYNELSSRVDSYKKSIEKLEADLDSSSTRCSLLSSSLESKDLENKDLLEKLEESKQQVLDMSSEVSDLLDSVSELSSQIEELQLSHSTELSDLESKLQNLESENSNLKLSISKLESEIASKTNDSSKVDELTKSLEDYKSRCAKSDKDLITLNKELVALRQKVSSFEESKDTGGNSALLSRVADIQAKLDTIEDSLMGRLDKLLLPESRVNLNLLRGLEDGYKFKNIQFVYSGSAESRKGTYKCLLNKLRDVCSKTIIVDIVSETSIDYVFEINKLKSGLDWLTNGGSIDEYLNPTCLYNVSALSLGFNYVNDISLLNVDWVSRLKELDSYGYDIWIYLGDISNLVGRVFHESFSSYGSSSVYVQGSSVSARTIISNLRGISNSNESTIYYFDFNRKLEKFYNIVAKTNTCVVLE